MAKTTHSEYVKSVKNLKGNEISVLGQYVNTMTKILHLCNSCKLEWEIRPNNILNGQGCPICAKKTCYAHRTPLTSSFKKSLKSVTQKISLLSEIKPKTKALFRCENCRHEWESEPYRILKGHGCPKCRGVSLDDKKSEHLTKLKAQHGLEIKLLEYNWPPRKVKSTYKCRQGHTFETSSNVAEKNGCPICAHSKRFVGNSLKEVRINRRTFKVQGYEEQALKWLLANTKLKASDLSVYSDGTVPHISWKNKERTKYHFPDIFVAKSNTLYEVKSKATIGLAGFVRLTPAEIFKSVKTKALKAIEQGFKYEILLMTESGERLKLPKDWYNLTFKEFKSIMS